MHRNHSGTSSVGHLRRHEDDRDRGEEREFIKLSDMMSYVHLNRLSQSPARDSLREDSARLISNLPDDYDINDPEVILRLKWLDNSPRMSRLREHRHKRLVNKLEQFELWDMEQERKQKQYEMAREQRYKNIMDRLKSQEFCVNVMKRRHESDLETTRELETYNNDHIYVDALDDPKNNYHGPITQYRKFQAEMDEKMKNLQQDMDLLNPRYKIEQAIIPRIERTRELYSVEPDIFTRKGKRVLKRPNLNEPKYRDYRQPRDPYYDSDKQPKLKSIIHGSYGNEPIEPIRSSLSKMKAASNSSNHSNGSEKKAVNFNDDIKYSNGNGKKAASAENDSSL